MIKFEINFGVLKGGARIRKNRVRRIFSRADKILKAKRKSAISIAFISEKEMARLNKVYHKSRGVTDVLSFNADSKDGNLGEIVISYSKAIKQGKDTGRGTMKEIENLIAHGLLHLAGFDHRTKKEEDNMFSIQKSLCE